VSEGSEGFVKRLLSVSNKKALGVYYTPEVVAQAIVEWAIRDRSCEVFDPSFGGCAFFRAALERLRDMGSKWPGKQIYGVDVDQDARDFLEPALKSGGDAKQFLTTDFLSVSAQEMPGAPFEAVVGNPPYIRHHLLSRETRFRAQGMLREKGLAVSGRASMWAYFVMHSIDFVAGGGRLGMVLPAAFLCSDYGHVVRDKILSSFSRVTVLIVGKPVFSDAQELSVLLLAEDRKDCCGELRVGLVPSTDHVLSACRDIDHWSHGVDHLDRGGVWIRGLIEPSVLAAFEKIKAKSEVIPLGALADVRIGVVTGANDVFIVSQAWIGKSKTLRNWARPVVDRASHLRGLCFARKDHRALAKKGLRCFLLDIPSQRKLPARLNAYLDEPVSREAAERYKCRTREFWYSIGDAGCPAAFLHYMCADAPRLVINQAGATCTNAIHRLTWKRRLSRAEAKWLAISSVSTLFKFGAEMIGRRYGGGVLKIEPSDARRLLLVSPGSATASAEAVFVQIDELLRKGRNAEATELADRVVLREALGMCAQEISALAAARDFLCELRLGKAGRVGESKGKIGDAGVVAAVVAPTVQLHGL